MKKNILIATVLVFIFVSHTLAGEVSKFTVNLPDGLYLYQPKIKKEPFSPLFIVDKGKLIDPYALRDSIGMERFDKEYVRGKGFNVYVGGERIGTLSDMILLINNPENVKEYSSDMVGYGKYTGKPLPGEVSDAPLFADDFNAGFATIKAVLTPETFKDSKERGQFNVTEEDARRAADAVRERYGREARDTIAGIISKERKKIIGEKGSSLAFLAAIDLDGDGKKELIGDYSFSYKYVNDKAPVDVNYSGLYEIEVLFVLRDSGKVEKVLTGVESLPAFSLGGVIDLDGDGVYELIVQESLSPDVEDDPGGKRIAVLRRYPAGWKKVFSSVRLSDEIH